LKIGLDATLAEFVQSVEDACHIISSQNHIVPNQARLRDAYDTVRSAGPVLVRVFGALAMADVVEGSFASGDLVRFGAASVSGVTLEIPLVPKEKSEASA
jgi:hypothetical protein